MSDESVVVKCLWGVDEAFIILYIESELPETGDLLFVML